MAEQYLSREEIEEISEKFPPEPVTDNTLREIGSATSYALSDDCMTKFPCIVCECGIIRKDLDLIQIENLPIARMRSVLQAAEDLPDRLRVDYDCSGVSMEFHGLLLCREGFVCSEGVSPKAWVCHQMHAISLSPTGQGRLSASAQGVNRERACNWASPPAVRQPHVDRA